MKKLMILGAGIYQVPLIKKAREMGHSVTVVSCPGPYPGFAFADRILHLDTTDSPGVLRAAREEGIDGILTTGTDVAVRTIGEVCRALDLPGISFEAASLLTDKLSMKEAFRRGHVPTSDFLPVTSLEEALAAGQALGYPVMMKACDSSGSRGVSLVASESDMAPAYSLSASVSRTDHCLVEKISPGREIGLDAFVLGGEPVLLLPHDKFTITSGQVTVPLGHSFPYRTSPSLTKKLESAVRSAIEATGADHCALNFDIMVDGDEIQVLEAGGRCGATCIPELIERYSGISYYEQMIHAALGEPCNFYQTRQDPCMAKLFMSRRGGRVSGIDLEAIQTLCQQAGADFSLDISVGDLVNPMKNGTDRFGHLICSTDDESAFDHLMEELLSHIHLS